MPPIIDLVQIGGLSLRVQNFRQNLLFLKDLTGGKFKGHYTIRALIDMPLSEWKKKLTEWADEHAVHVKQYKKANNNV
jgi:hypothetical protein